MKKFSATLLICLHLLSLSGQSKIDSLRSAFEKHPWNYRATAALFDYWKKNNKDSAKVWVDKTLFRGEDINDTFLIGLAYNFKAMLTSESGDIKSAVTFYSKSWNYTGTRNDTGCAKIHAAISKNYGLCLANAGRIEEAETYLLDCIRSAIKLRDSIILVNGYITYGQVLKDQGNYDKALKTLFTGVSIAEIRKDNAQLGRLMNNIANVYSAQEKFEDALNFYQRSVEYKLKTGNQLDIANTYGNMGVIYFSMNNYEMALEYYHRSLNLKEKSGDKKGSATTINNIGLVFVKQGQYDSAEFYLKKALDLRTSLGDEMGVASTMNGLGGLYLNTKDCKKALSYILGSIERAEHLGAKEILEGAYRHAAEGYECSGDFKNAYRYAMMYTDLHDSLTKEATLRLSEEMKTKYQTDKKEQQIKDLEQQKVTSDLQRVAATEREKKRRYLFLAAILIGVLIIGFLVVRQRENRRSRTKLQSAFNEIEQKNKSITDSIKYAERIQSSLLPSERSIQNNMKRLKKDE